MNIRETYIFLLIVSAFISISLFEIFVVAGLLWIIFDFVRDRKINSGKLGVPVFVFSFVSVLSTIIYVPKLVSKGIEEGIFQLLYFFNIKSERNLIKRISYLFVFIGIVLIPLIIYNYLHFKDIKPVWGGAFEVGQFYGMFSLISAALGIYFYKNSEFKKAVLFIFLSVLFFGVLIFAHKRSPLLGFIIVAYLFIFVLDRNKIIPKFYFVGLNVILTVLILVGYVYLSKTDYRFQLLNKVITGEKPLNYQTLNRISSLRVGIFMDGVNVIRSDIKNGNVLNLLIGHGVRSGIYLPHKYDRRKRPKYESIFIVSEFIEKGIIGLIAVLSIFYIAFKRFLTIKIKNHFDLVSLGVFFPLLIHLIGSIFTFFWDALLPLYLLLFKIGETYFEKKR